MLKRLVIDNYKVFDSFALDFNENLNILVGNNEVGKSTILEAIYLALTKRLHGRPLEHELSPHLFNRKCVAAYLQSLVTGVPNDLPHIAIELYFDEVPALAALRGSINSRKEDAVGIRLEVVFDTDYTEEYAALLRDRRADLTTIPAEYYTVRWHSFADSAITHRSLPVTASYVDAATIRLQSGTDYYLQDLIRTDLDSKERVALSIAYRRLKETFSQEDSIKGINLRLTSRQGAITDKTLAISIDTSQRSSWEHQLVPHLDELPFHLIGQGEQSALKIMLALERRAGVSDVVLIEEPENHLSFSSMNILLNRLRERCAGKQIMVATHSAFVLNKLGLRHLLLLGPNSAITSLKSLSADTQEYFEKLPGYDTLRLVLAKKVILVEGPSDELIVQRAYRERHGRLPIENGVDVISVRGLSFVRFLEIAKELNTEIRVVTDNDGDCARLDRKYAPYSSYPHIRVFRSDDQGAATLEPQIARANSLATLNQLFETSCLTMDDLLIYMRDHKTDCALAIFRGATTITFPDYIQHAVAEE